MTVRQKMKRTQNATPDKAQGRDMFQTPNYATELLIPFLSPATYIWEPASGRGKIARALEEHEFGVWATDIVYHDTVDEVFNFFTEDKDANFMSVVDYIITNPPFSLKRHFFNKCMYYWSKYNIPFALLIPADYSGWIIKACQLGAIKIVPTRRIDYITPSGLDGASGIHTSNFHSMWLTMGLGYAAPNRTELFVELSSEAKKNI